jgi:NMD protein affecting ribosome stability and mRNA decay
MEIEVREMPLVRCHACGRVLIEGRWSRARGMAAIQSYVDKAVKGHDAELTGIIPEGAIEKKMPRKITLIVSIEGADEQDEIEIPVSAKNKLCDVCSKSEGQYFEGYLQLRNATPEQIEYAKRKILQKGAIKKETVKDSSADFTVSSNKAIVHATREIAKKYSGIHNITTTLHTKDKQSSKEVHRVTGLFRFIDISKGDIVLLEAKHYYVLGIDKKAINLALLSKKNLKRAIPLESYASLQKVAPFDTTILREKPVIMILDENYQPHPAFVFGKLQKHSKNPKAIRTDEGLFIIP